MKQKRKKTIELTDILLNHKHNMHSFEHY